MRMIFHVPFPLDENATSASGIRPVRMLSAFRSIGLDVTVVSGYSDERAQKARSLLRSREDLKSIAFMYSEASTSPTALTDPDHVPRHPLVDFQLMRGVRRAGGRVGLFYRDVYWKFPEYKTMVPLFQRMGALASYRWDLRQYRSALDVMFLPSLGMAGYLPQARYEVEALPPAHSIATPSSATSAPLRLLYVGGVGPHYKFHTLVRAVGRVPDASLTICTREKEWLTEGPSYDPLPSNVTVVHKVGDAELDPLYANANVGVLSTRPEGYFAFAVPYKLYEYIGHGLPILATSGTLTGRTVEEGGIGWTLGHDEDAIAGHLRALIADPKQWEVARTNVLAAREGNTWENRARAVVSRLTGEEAG